MAEITTLVDAANASNLVSVPRALLLDGIPSSFVNTALPTDPSPLVQFQLDLAKTNRVERLADGIVPVVVLLQNAAFQLKLRGAPETAVFERTVNRIGNVTSGVPPLPDPTTLDEVVQKERIIGVDDSVDLVFLKGGLEIARAVALITVPRFENGNQIMVGGGPWLMRGTAWLVAPKLALTNHHVINSRLDGEAPASDADFERQALGASVRFDFDAMDADGSRTTVARLVAKSTSLDYALIELADDLQRPIPTINKDKVVVDATTRMAVNIVQHPRGEYKRVAVRNNLVSAADNDTVRYFTDTDQGSSGSPVCDDRWRVVALHRGARRVDGVQFQGKAEAFVNFGSQIQSVLADVTAADAVAAAVIDTAQPD
jgi:V8-like Glu-specific endopeptidase